MIPFDFEYYKPASVNEALQNYRYLQSENKRAIYYAGGTEFISLARRGLIEVDAVIDLKDIPECNVLESRDGQVTIGAALSLAQLADSRLFPLLSRQVRGIADHTSRNRITLGGNLSGKTPYREALLPLLICDSRIVVAREERTETVSVHERFNERYPDRPGEFNVQVKLDADDMSLPFACLKKTRFTKVEYPLASIASILKDGRIRVAISGICGFPFRELPIEEALNDRAIPLEQRIEQSLHHLPGPVLNDLHGSDEYRLFLLRRMLAETIRELEGETT